MQTDGLGDKILPVGAQYTAMPTILLDNGSHALKIGLIGEPARIFPNYALRVNDSNFPLYGSYLNGLPITTEADKTSVCKAGEIYEWKLEDLIWRDALLQLYQNQDCKLSDQLHTLFPTCSDLDLITTTSTDAHPAAKRQFLEYCFETMQFASVVAQPPQAYLTRHSLLSNATTGIILDMGYAGMSSTAFLYTNPILYSHTLVDCGGSLLNSLFTALLQKTIDPGFLVDIRKRCLLIESLQKCFFTATENSQIEIAFCAEKNNYLIKAISDSLPAPTNDEGRCILDIRNTEGVVQNLLEQIATHVPNMITTCIQSLPTELQSLSKGNVFICGGLANIPPMTEITKDVLLTSALIDNVVILPNPQTAVYDGMQLYAETAEYARSRITRQLYEEYGCVGLEHN